MKPTQMPPQPHARRLDHLADGLLQDVDPQRLAKAGVAMLGRDAQKEAGVSL